MLLAGRFLLYLNKHLFMMKLHFFPCIILKMLRNYVQSWICNVSPKFPWPIIAKPCCSVVLKKQTCIIALSELCHRALWKRVTWRDTILLRNMDLFYKIAWTMLTQTLKLKLYITSEERKSTSFPRSEIILFAIRKILHQ